MESLSGLTDFVVSITNVRGGLKISDPLGDWAHSWHLHATHLKAHNLVFIIINLINNNKGMKKLYRAG